MIKVAASAVKRKGETKFHLTHEPQQKAPIIERVGEIPADPDSSPVPLLEEEIDSLVYALCDLTVIGVVP